jgi:hypothetical protein
MRRALFATTFVLALCSPAAARQGAARKIDEFGAIQFSDLMARLDYFAIELQNAPGAAGVVVAYPAKHDFPGWPVRRAEVAVDYLVNTRGLDAARISFSNGGLRGETAFELWLVPPGAEFTVKPFDAALLMSGEKTALPFDRFAVVERGDDIVSEYGGEGYPTAPGPYKYFAEVLRADPALRGCVIGYTSRRGGSAAAARRIASRAKMTIAKSHAVDVRRVVALGGGRRDYKTIELWLVPPGAELPKPTPAAPPSRRRRRGR